MGAPLSEGGCRAERHCCQQGTLDLGQGTLGHFPSEHHCWGPTWTPPWDTKFMFLASNANCRQVVFPQASETRVRSFWALSSSLR